MSMREGCGFRSLHVNHHTDCAAGKCLMNFAAHDPLHKYFSVISVQITTQKTELYNK